MTHTSINHTNVVSENPAFCLACFEFELCLTEATEFPVEKGSSFHGAFGLALARIGTSFRDYFYNPSPASHWSDTQQAPPRPYVLIPPLEEKTHYAAGEKLNLGIVLYGSALNYFLIVFAALEHLGEFMGLGKQRAHFTVDSIKQLTLDKVMLIYQNRHWLATSQPMAIEQFFINTPDTLPRLCLKHSTRLRLKADNQLLYTAPTFALFMNRLLARINALTTLYGSGIVIAPEQKQQLLKLAESVVIEHSTLAWHDWQRHSQRSHSTMPFGGLLGDTIYQGELAPFIPWLSLGQWIGVGGKTSFGLGLYELSYLEWKEDEYY